MKRAILIISVVAIFLGTLLYNKTDRSEKDNNVDSTPQRIEHVYDTRIEGVDFIIIRVDDVQYLSSSNGGFIRI